MKNAVVHDRIRIDYSGFSVKKYSPPRHSAATPQPKQYFTTETPEFAETGVFLDQNSLLWVLRASALKTVADPSQLKNRLIRPLADFGGSAVQSPSSASRESLKSLMLP
jgi:hypothetical protein